MFLKYITDAVFLKVETIFKFIYIIQGQWEMTTNILTSVDHLNKKSLYDRLSKHYSFPEKNM